MPFIPEITSEDVREIVLLQAEDVSVFISQSQIFLDNVFKDVPINQDLYRLIGLYITAHFALLKEGQIVTDKVDVLSTTFNMTTDLALNSTTYGQQAVALDVTGSLAELNAQAKRRGNPSEGSKHVSLEIF